MDAHAIPRRHASGKSNISLFSLIATYFTHSQDLSSVKEISVKEILLGGVGHCGAWHVRVPFGLMGSYLGYHL